MKRKYGLRGAALLGTAVLLGGWLASTFIQESSPFKSEDLPASASTGTTLKPVMKKTLEGVIEGRALTESLNREEYDALREDLKKSDSLYLERQILARNETLRKFRQLHLKVIKRSDEISLYEEMLRDSELIGESLAHLNAEMSEWSAENQVERMLWVDLLSEAIEASKGVRASPIHEHVARLVQSPVIFDKTKPADLRKSMYVDRMEVFRSYVKTYPERAEGLLADIPASKYKTHLAEILKISES